MSESPLNAGKIMHLSTLLDNLTYQPHQFPVNSGKKIAKAKGKILIVGDPNQTYEYVTDLLKLEEHKVLEIDNNQEIIKTVVKNNIDIVLLDISPRIDSFEACAQLKQHPLTAVISVIFMAYKDDTNLRVQCYNAGGEDLLTKPLDNIVLRARVNALIRQKRLYEDLDRTKAVLFSIAKAVETPHGRSNDSCTRLATLVKSFGSYLNLEADAIESLLYAAYLHDIGTIALPRHIPLRQGELTKEEREIINHHVLIGEKICEPLKNKEGILPIIRHHHERWDGSGYPDGLRGEDIPYLAQVFQIIDIYEALTSERSHRASQKIYTPLQALAIIEEETLKGWRNPQLVRVFAKFMQDSLM